MLWTADSQTIRPPQQNPVTPSHRRVQFGHHLTVGHLGRDLHDLLPLQLRHVPLGGRTAGGDGQVGEFGRTRGQLVEVPVDADAPKKFGQRVLRGRERLSRLGAPVAAVTKMVRYRMTRVTGDAGRTRCAGTMFE